MKNKFISKQSNEILTYFNEQGIQCFDYEQAKKALPKSKDSTLRELLRDMTRRGLLMRVKRGLYYVIPYEQDPENFMPDWHLLAGHLVNGADYYIGYYSALQIHNLITQPSLKEQIVVSEQLKPAILKVKETDFQFIYHNKQHFFGAKKVWIDNFNKVICSDLEKTIVDCLFKPDYSGYSLEEILVEKLRSVMQRMQARDFYDIWYLLEFHGLELNFYRNEFIAKCENKEVESSDFFNKLEQRLPQYKARWQKSMKDQIKDLPEFEQVERELVRHLKNLEL